MRHIHSVRGALCLRCSSFMMRWRDGSSGDSSRDGWVVTMGCNAFQTAGEAYAKPLLTRDDLFAFACRLKFTNLHFLLFRESNFITSLISLGKKMEIQIIEQGDCSTRIGFHYNCHCKIESQNSRKIPKPKVRYLFSESLLRLYINIFQIMKNSKNSKINATIWKR